MALASDILLKAYETATPVNVSFEITRRCNLRCLHCYNTDRRRRSAFRPKGELRFSEIRRILDDVRETGGLYLALTGGEPLLHPRLGDIVRHAVRRNMLVCLRTNGTRITSRIARELSDAGVSETVISLFGGTARTHDAFCGVAGSFVKAIRGARAAKAAGIDVSLAFCVTLWNYREIPRMIALAKRLKFSFQLDPNITARYDGDSEPLKLRIGRAELEKLYRGPLVQYLPAPDCRPTRSVQCACARSNVGITSTGIVYPCIAAPVPSGNLREQSFAEIWKSSPALEAIRRLTLDDFTACKPCPFRSTCRRNSGLVYAVTGCYTGPEAWTCMEAEVIQKIKIHEDKDVYRRSSFVDRNGKHQRG